VFWHNIDPLTPNGLISVDHGHSVSHRDLCPTMSPSPPGKKPRSSKLNSRPSALIVLIVTRDRARHQILSSRRQYPPSTTMRKIPSVSVLSVELLVGATNGADQLWGAARHNAEAKR